MKIHRFLALTALACACFAGTMGKLTSQSATGSAQAQQQVQHPGPPGTIRVHVRLIPVDVTVSDKDDKPVLDLRKEDFTILENGRPQEIQHFFLQKLTPKAAPSTEEHPRLQGGPIPDLAPQSARTFLILMGRGRHQRNFKSMDALIRFVRNDLLPQDRVAVFAYNRATDFTTDHERAAQVLERYKQIHEKIEPWFENKFKGLAAIYGSKEVPKSWQSEIDKIFEIPEGLAFRGIPPGRVTVEGKSAQDTQRITDLMLRDEANRGMREGARSPLPGGLVGGENIGSTRFEKAELKLLTDLPFDEYAATSAGTNQDVQNIFTSIEYLRYMEGEKHLIFFTENGLFLPRTQYDSDVANVASDARVAIHTFQTGGVFLDSSTYSSTDLGYDRAGNAIWDPQSGAVSVQSPGRSVSVGGSRAFALSSLKQISDLTGGQAAIHKDIGTALARVDETTRVMYLLGYYPNQAAWDGKYRDIVVKVNRPGVKTAYRHGYFARDILDPYDRREFVAYSRISAAAAYPAEVRDLPFKVTMARQKDPAGKPELRVDLKIDGSKIGFKADNNLHSGKLQIAVFAAGPQDKNLGNDWQTMNMDLGEESYQRVLRDGVSYSTSIPVRYNIEALKIVVYDFGSDKVGSTVRQLR